MHLSGVFMVEFLVGVEVMEDTCIMHLAALFEFCRDVGL